LASQINLEYDALNKNRNCYKLCFQIVTIAIQNERCIVVVYYIY